MVAQTLRILPRLSFIGYTNPRWVKVVHAINVSKSLADSSGESPTCCTPKQHR